MTINTNNTDIRKFNLLLNRGVHASLKQWAAKAEVTMQGLLSEIIETAVRQHEAPFMPKPAMPAARPPQVVVRPLVASAAPTTKPLATAADASQGFISMDDFRIPPDWVHGEGQTAADYLAAGGDPNDGGWGWNPPRVSAGAR